jgi:hypothetical protein
VPEQVGQRTTLVRFLAQVEREVDPTVADMQVVAVIRVLERDVLWEPDIVDDQRPGLLCRGRGFLFHLFGWCQPLRQFPTVDEPKVCQAVAVEQLGEPRAHRRRECAGKFVLDDSLECLDHPLEFRTISQFPVDVAPGFLQSSPEFGVDRVGRLFTEEALDRFEQLVVGLELVANRLFCHGALRVLPRMAWISIECHYAPPLTACLAGIGAIACRCSPARGA